MLGNNVPIGIEKWIYEKQKYFLLTNSAGFKILRNSFIKKYKLNSLSDHNLERQLDRVFGEEVAFKKDYLQISEALQIPSPVLHHAILNLPPEGSGLDDGDFLVYGVDDITPIIRKADFIRVWPQTRPDSVMKAFKRIKKMCHMDNYYGLNDDRVVPVSDRNKPITDLKKKIVIYLNIEAYLQSHYVNRRKSKPDKGKKTDKLDRRSNPVVERAIWKTLDRMKLHDEDFKTIRDHYYTLLDYYLIPTMQQFKHLLIRPLQISKN